MTFSHAPLSLNLKAFVFGCVFLISCFLPTAQTQADHDLAREPLPKSWKAEAELTDVFFLNQKLGWSVGAQGVILRTTDGGRNWTEISNAKNSSQSELSLDQKFKNMRRGISTGSTGVVSESELEHQSINCRFESIHFVDENHGWIAGGYEVPYVNRSRAVVMRTSDGGKTWHDVGGILMPRLMKIRFSSMARGWAVGETGNLFPSGVYTTSNGGSTWESSSSNKWKNWKNAVQTSEGFVAIDDSGTPNAIQRDRMEASVLDRALDGRFNDLLMLDANSGFAVGEHGLFARTANGGKSWTPVKLELEGMPASVQANIDFNSASTAGSNIWFAGNPGSRLFRHNSITGKTTLVQTPINTPIRRIQFVDENFGWAVGALGRIIATSNGGQTWEIQRGQRSRVAMLCVASRLQDLPFEILAKYASEDERMCASVVLNASADQARIATQATERLGAAALITYAKDDQVLRKLVREIRVLRPNVVLCNSGRASIVQDNDPVTLVEKAIRMAGDSLSFPQQVNELGLKTWQVNRFATLDPTGKVGIEGNRLLPRTGMLIEDQIAVSRALVGHSVLMRKGRNYRVLDFAGNYRGNSSDLLSGLSRNVDIPTRDKSSKRGNLSLIQQASSKQKKFEEFIRFDATSPQDFLVWRRQVESFVIPMEQGLAGTWMMQLTERYLSSGKMELAAASATMLATRWPNHALTPAALTWLTHYYASVEFGDVELAKRSDLYSSLVQQPSASSADALANAQKPVTPPTKMQITRQNGLSKIEWVAVDRQAAGDPNLIQQVSHSEDQSDVRESFYDQRLRTASQFLSRISQRDPELMAGSQYRFLKAQIIRRLNGSADTEGLFRNLIQRKGAAVDAVSVGANRELAMIHDGPVNDGLQAVRCLKTNLRPVLDGDLDEPIWHEVVQADGLTRSNIRLYDSGIARPDVTMFAYDDEYLYGAIYCQKLNIDYYKNQKKARPRDPDLTGRDRVEIAFDFDRDYRSVSRFVIDHRGWVSENCSGCSNWNPEWFVSQSETESTWSVEFAIPLGELTGGAFEAGNVWAISASRRAFDNRNLWKPEDQAVSYETGLMAGLRSNPQLFELFRFETPSQSSQSE